MIVDAFVDFAYIIKYDAIDPVVDAKYVVGFEGE